MSTGHAITFEPAGRVVDYIGSDKNEYVLPDGRRLDVETELAWCHQCGKITEADDVPTRDELEALIASFTDPRSTRSQMKNRRLLQLVIEDSERRRHAARGSQRGCRRPSACRVE